MQPPGLDMAHRLHFITTGKGICLAFNGHCVSITSSKRTVFIPLPVTVVRSALEEWRRKKSLN
jgi:hypothetical protein